MGFKFFHQWSFQTIQIATVQLMLNDLLFEHIRVTLHITRNIIQAFPLHGSLTSSGRSSHHNGFSLVLDFTALSRVINHFLNPLTMQRAPLARAARPRSAVVEILLLTDRGIWPSRVHIRISQHLTQRRVMSFYRFVVSQRFTLRLLAV